MRLIVRVYFPNALRVFVGHAFRGGDVFANEHQKVKLPMHVDFFLRKFFPPSLQTLFSSR